MRLLGVDYGTRYIGLALSDELGCTARPFRTLARSGWKRDLAVLRQIILERHIDKLVIGVPRNMDGSWGPAARRAENFARKLEADLHLPALRVDERLSTAEARQLLRELRPGNVASRSRLNAIAAAFILQRYLDREAAPGGEKPIP
ncbi:MAG: Holliday junction resolvase RuvX [Acidobacteria bacterium]|nr:Holliday junction resolvase RuvX [Acidobacteriota bacterium]